MIMNVEILKCDGQYPNSMHTLAISINFLRQTASLTYLLKCLYTTLSSPGVDELLHFTMALMNFSSEKGPHFLTGLL